MITRMRSYATLGRNTFVISLAALLLTAFAFAGMAAAQNPVPLINQPLVPDAVKPGAMGFTLTVNGTGFASGATVNWNGSPLATTFVGGSRLTARVPASDIAKAGTVSVTVVNPTPGGGTSNVAFFEASISSRSIGLSAPAAFGVPGNSSGGIAVGDFNHDGKLDLAEANGVINNDHVSVLLGNGDGTFQPAVNYSVVDSPQSVAVGDFNRDGKLDLVAAHYYSSVVSVLLGNGDGTFQPAVNYSVGGDPHSVAVGDFNRDGNLDLVVASGANNDVSVLLGNGDGSFQAAVNYGVGSVPDSVAVGDLNRDGNLDLVVANSNSNDVSVLLGDGDGTFQPAVNYSVGTYPDSVAVADFNRDGNLDVVVANGGSNDVSVLLGNGDGTLQAAVNYPGGGAIGPLSVTVGDLNGDGKLDLAVSNDGNVSALLGNGDGTFQLAGEWPSPGSNSLALGDFNGDGRLDVALSDGSDAAVSVLLQIPAVSLSKTSLTFADLVVGTTSAAQAMVLTNTSAFTLTISSIVVTGTNGTDFKQSNTCGSGLPAGRKCTIEVGFTPAQIGPRTASVTITDSAAGSPHSIALIGTGVVSGPNATLSGTSLTFATQLLGTTSPAQSATLTNYGTTTLSITSIGFNGINPGDFAQADTCGTSVLAGTSCTISVSFTPSGVNARTATLSIADNASGSPQTVSLSGIGTVVNLSPTSLLFCLGCGPHTKSVTLTNVGKTTLHITSMTITEDFSQTNNCGSSLAAGARCTISVTEHGDFLYDYGVLDIGDDGGGSPQFVSLEYVWKHL